MSSWLISSRCVKHEALTPHIRQEASRTTGQVSLPFPLLPGGWERRPPSTWSRWAARTPPPARCSPGPAGPAQGSPARPPDWVQGVLRPAAGASAAGAAARGRRPPCTRALEAHCGHYPRRLLVGQWQKSSWFSRELPLCGDYIISLRWGYWDHPPPKKVRCEHRWQWESCPWGTWGKGVLSPTTPPT